MSADAPDLTADAIAVLNGFAGMVARTDRYPGKDEFGDERTAECLDWARGCVERARAAAAGCPPEDDAVEPCSVDYPVTREQALGWAQQARWYLTGYYKYAFTFEAYCTVAYPDNPEAAEVTARVCVGGDAGRIYKFNVAGDVPLTWDELCCAGVPRLTIEDGGNLLIAIEDDDD